MNNLNKKFAIVLHHIYGKEDLLNYQIDHLLNNGVKSDIYVISTTADCPAFRIYSEKIKPIVIKESAINDSVFNINLFPFALKYFIPFVEDLFQFKKVLYIDPFCDFDGNLDELFSYKFENTKAPVAAIYSGNNAVEILSKSILSKDKIRNGVFSPLIILFDMNLKKFPFIKNTSHFITHVKYHILSSFKEISKFDKDFYNLKNLSIFDISILDSIAFNKIFNISKFSIFTDTVKLIDISLSPDSINEYSLRIEQYIKSHYSESDKSIQPPAEENIQTEESNITRKDLVEKLPAQPRKKRSPRQQKIKK